jgi:hypothetical protein
MWFINGSQATQPNVMKAALRMSLQTMLTPVSISIETKIAHNRRVTT